MKKTISMIIATAVAMTLVSSAFAQGAGPAGGKQKGGAQGKDGQKGGRRAGMMGMDEPILAKLNLTADQKKGVKELKEKQMNAMKALRDKAKGGDRAAMREEFMKISKGYRDGLQKILTPGQMTDYEKQMKELRKKMMDDFKKNGGPGGAGGAGRPGGAGKPGGNGGL